MIIKWSSWRKEHELETKDLSEIRMKLIATIQIYDDRVCCNFFDDKFDADEAPQ